MHYDEKEDALLRSAAIQNAHAVLRARHQAEEALEQKTEELAYSLELVRATLESTADAILVTDESRHVSTFNSNYIRMWSVPESLMAMREHDKLIQFCAQFFEDPILFAKRVDEIYNTSPVDSHDVLQLRDGRVFERYTKKQSIEGRNLARVWSFRDVTPHKLAADELRQQREWFRVTLSSIGDAVITTDLQGNVTFMNAVAEAATGWQTEAARGLPLETVFNIIHESSRQRAFNPINTVLREGTSVGLANHTALISKSGTEIAIEDTAAPIRDSDGKIRGAVMVFHDVTEKRRSQEALEANKNRLALAMEIGRFGTWDWDLASSQVSWCEMFESIHGISGGKGGKGTIDDFKQCIYFEDRPRIWAELQDTIHNHSDYHIEYRVQNADGKEKWVEGRGKIILDSAGNPYRMSGVCSDITDRKQADKVRSRLAAIVDSSDDAIISKTLDGIILTWNDAAKRMFGFSAEEAVGKSIALIFPPEKMPEENEIISRLRRGERIEHYETIRRRKDGKLLDVSLSVSPIRDSTGKIIAASKIARDITGQKIAARELQEEARYLEILNNTGTSIASTLDLQTLVQTATDSGTLLAGAQFGAFFYHQQGGSFQLYALAGVPRGACDKFELPRDTPIFEPTFRHAAVIRLADITKDSRYGTTLPNYGMPKGTPPLRSYLAVPVISRSGEVIGGLIFGHAEANRFPERAEKLISAIAAQVATGIDNARLYEAAQKEISERKRAEEIIKAAKDEAEKANRAKDEFLAVVSHELRTPLTAMLGWARMLKNGGLDSVKAAHGISVIERNVTVQTQLIEDLLDVSRIISGKLSLTIGIVDIVKVIGAATESVKAAIDAKQIKLEVINESSLSVIAGDSGRLQQVFWNLLSNSVKFTQKGGVIKVRIFQSGSSLIVTFTDNGKGIRPEFLPYVFQRFHQDDSGTTRSFGGLGLGLAIVRHLIEQHGGHVEVASEGENKGSTFTIELPIRAIPKSSALLESVGTQDAQTVNKLDGIRILVVEDDPDSRDLISAVLESAGATIRAVATADAAMNAIKDSAPDVLISDIGMPVKGGYELITEVRSLPADRGSRIPALALTAYARAEDRLRAIKAGFNEHVPKPIDPSDLVRKVFQFCKRR